MIGALIEPRKGGYIYVDNYVPVIKRTENFLNGSTFMLLKADGPSTNNEYIKTIAETTSNVNVIGGTGCVTIHHAAGKKVMISNMSGQMIVKSIIPSDRSTVSVPAGIVVVSVEGEVSKKIVVQ